MTIRHALTAAAGNTGPAPAPTDPQFNYVSLLLHGDGTNGAQNNTFVSTPITAPASGYFAGYFDGSGDYLTAAGNSAFDFGTGDFTIEFFANMSLPSTGYVFLLNSTYATTSQGLSVRFGDSGFGYKLQVGVDVYSLSTVWSCSLTQAQASNAWLHIAFTRSSGVCRLFVNGVVQNINSGANPSTYPFTSFTDSTNLSSSTGVKIGDGVLGYMSNVRVIKGTALYTANFTPPTAPLTAISGTSLLTCMSGFGATFSDLSSNNFTITRFGNATMTGVATTPPGAVPYAGYFDGSADYLTFDASSAAAFGTGAFTVEGWFYLTDISATRQIFDCRSYSGPVPWGCEFQSGAPSWYNGSSTTAATAVTANTWNHVAFVREGTGANQAKMYINGVVVATYTDSVNYGTMGTSARIGYNLGAANSFAGYMSNLRIVKGTAVYTSNFAPPNSPLTAITNTSLLTCQSATFIDNSPNNFTITVNGNTTVTSSYILPAITRNGNTTQGSLSPYGNLWSNYFDGSGDYLTIPANTAFDFAAGNFTVEGWFYPTSLGALNEMFCINYVSGTDGFATVRVTATSTGAIYFLCSSDGATWINTSTTATNALALNIWTHVAAVRNGSSFTLYVNGVSALTYTSSATLFNANNVSYLGVQNNRGSFTSFFLGYMSNVRAVKGTAVYTSAFTPPTAPLTAISGTSLLTCQSNRFRDASANNFTITRTGDVRVTKEAPFLPTAAYSTSTIGGSGYFDGTGDYLSLTTNSAFDFGTGNFTIEFWFYSTVNSASYGGFVVRGTQRYVVSMGSSGNTPEMWINDYSLSGPICASATNICNGAWNHVAAVRNGNVFTMYVNGVAGGTSNTWTGSIVSSTAPMWIGNDPDITSRPVTGYISNVRITKGVAVYTAAFTPPTAPLTAPLNTSLLLNFTNAGIFDNAAENDLETVGNAQISTSVKKYGTGSLAFDGSGDGLKANNSTAFALSNGNFTIESWVYLTAYSSNYSGGNYGAAICASKSGGSINNGFEFDVLGTASSYTSLAFVARNGSSNAVFLNPSFSFSLNTWYHVAVVKNGSTFTCYVNGTSIGSTTSSTAWTNLSDLNVGWSGMTGYEYYWNGYIDDLRITKGYARYTANFTPPTAAFPDQ